MSLSRYLPGQRRRDMAVDLGTANTVVYVRNEGIILFEPSVIAIDETSGKVQAVGDEARRMIGRTPATIRATRPLRHGVIADFDVTEQMLRRFLAKANGQRGIHRRVVLCVPSGITDVEERAVKEATLTAGAREADVIEEPMAGAIGAGLPIAEPSGNMVVDIGGGTTEVAVISLGGMVVSRSLRVGGYDLDEAISSHIRTEHRMAIGSTSAEAIKLAVGTAIPLDEQLECEVRGRDLMSGLPRELHLGAEEVRAAIAAPLADIMTTVHAALEETPPELAADITKEGILLAGGGALLRGLDRRLEDETGMPVRVADEPLTCVAAGAGQSLEELDALGRMSTRR